MLSGKAPNAQEGPLLPKASREEWTPTGYVLHLHNYKLARQIMVLCAAGGVMFGIVFVGTHSVLSSAIWSLMVCLLGFFVRLRPKQISITPERLQFKDRNHTEDLPLAGILKIEAVRETVGGADGDYHRHRVEIRANDGSIRISTLDEDTSKLIADRLRCVVDQIRLFAPPYRSPR